MTEEFATKQRQWAEFVKEFRECQEALLRMQLFENGRLVQDRLAEWGRANGALMDVKRRMDDFIRQSKDDPR